MRDLIIVLMVIYIFLQDERIHQLEDQVEDLQRVQITLESKFRVAKLSEDLNTLKQYRDEIVGIAHSVAIGEEVTEEGFSQKRIK